ncbi:TetR/AcrR family transcriptional regulator [Dyella nitratireducens]|uniref:TetR family transcriptional regulator n=1 Tax=Dyella nitratireducens TaxID=1849580 RepID=A0ABQ1G9Y0_9GAMM|nr:TetR/AcrR family transcriptional regulator [Dyella nitratireducens]GGA39623.1 TetR family transcriptional regulator [Dyella nitratireducens]GLQ40464.1 TetR family transcriptional regulator [Dyella nitratireducens]
MPRLPTSSPRLTERKRSAIIDAAIDEFRVSGYETTSMDRIAARAEVSKRTVYNHFPSKEVLFAEILRHLWDAIAGGEAFAHHADRPLRDQLLELVAQKFRLLNDEAFVSLARVAIAAGIHSSELALDMVARMNEKEEGLTVWIRAAAKAGRLKIKDPVFASHQLESLIKGFAFWPQITLAQPPLDAATQKKVAESAVDMFLGYYAL